MAKSCCYDIGGVEARATKIFKAQQRVLRAAKRWQKTRLYTAEVSLRRAIISLNKLEKESNG